MYSYDYRLFYNLDISTRNTLGNVCVLYTLHYITLLYIVLYKYVVHALALLDCLVASFVGCTLCLQTRSGYLYRCRNCV